MALTVNLTLNLYTHALASKFSQEPMGTSLVTITYGPFYHPSLLYFLKSRAGPFFGYSLCFVHLPEINLRLFYKTAISFSRLNVCQWPIGDLKRRRTKLFMNSWYVANIRAKLNKVWPKRKHYLLQLQKKNTKIFYYFSRFVSIFQTFFRSGKSLKIAALYSTNPEFCTRYFTH